MINSLHCFETLNLSDEDRLRTEIYQNENTRRESLALDVDLDDWLNSLQLRVSVQMLDQSNLARAAQLLNKTNQFNLHTRRMSESSFSEWCRMPTRRSVTFSVADRFGDSGLTGIVTAEECDSNWTIVDFVMSCRVMGKGVEDAILSATLDQLGRVLPVKLSATATAKNGPAREFVGRVSPKVFPDGFCMPKPHYFACAGKRSLIQFRGIPV